MSNPVNPVITYSKTLFARGIETYNRETKSVSNIGGAQVFQLARWKTNQSPIVFNNEKFGKVLRELGATLFSLNRIRLGDDGKPLKVPGTDKNQRANSGLMLYTQYGEGGSDAKAFADRIIEACPELKGYIAPVVDIIDEVPQLQTLEGVQVPTADGELAFMNPRKCIILNVTSGSQGSSQYWSYAKMGGVTRESLDSATKTKGADISDII